jgi:hypothetical protein
MTAISCPKYSRFREASSLPDRFTKLQDSAPSGHVDFESIESFGHSESCLLLTCGEDDTYSLEILKTRLLAE